jgi:hypothetical protein
VRCKSVTNETPCCCRIGCQSRGERVAEVVLRRVFQAFLPRQCQGRCVSASRLPSFVTAHDTGLQPSRGSYNFNHGGWPLPIVAAPFSIYQNQAGNREVKNIYFKETLVNQHIVNGIVPDTPQCTPSTPESQHAINTTTTCQSNLQSTSV